MKKNIRINLILIILFFFTVVFSSSSQVDRYWTNAAGNNSWIDPDNWTDLDGMPGNPVSGDNVIFDATSPDDCNIDISSSLSLLNFVITSDYGGTINRITTAPLTINGTFEMEGGAFNAGSGSTVFAGTFNHTNGDFTASSGNMSFRNSFTSSGGGFIHNNGSVIFSTASLTINNTPVFNNVFFTNPAGSNSLTFTIANSITINGDLTYNTGSTSTSARIITVNTGTINLKGNLILGISTNPAPTNGGGTATIILNGTGTQTITGRADGAIPLPNLEINSSTNRVIEVIDVATTNGNFSITGSGNVAINTGTIAVKGDVTLSNTGSGGGGTGTVLLNNTSAAQIVSGTSTFGNSALPNLAIDKGSASLTFGGTVSLTGSLNYVNSGIINMGSSSIAYSGGDGQVVLSPTGNFPPYYVLAITGTGTKTVSSTLTTCSNLYLGNSDLNVGDVSTNYLRITDNTQNSIIYGGTGKIIGNLERAVTTGVNYTYNVAVSGGSTQQFDINFTNTGSDNDYVSISFSDAPPGTNVEDSTEAGVTFNRMIEGGY